jgi:predicted PurR-regulated permease PerM
VVVTALVQTTLTAAGLLIAGIPRPGLLTAVALVLCIAQVGPALVLIPAVIWSFSTGRTGISVVFLVITLGTLTVDNVLRPYLIKKGASLPLWLIFAGVIGGLLSFGVIGLFVGPVFLAVAYTVLGNWVAELGPEPAEAPADPPPTP